MVQICWVGGIFRMTCIILAAENRQHQHVVVELRQAELEPMKWIGFVEPPATCKVLLKQEHDTLCYRALLICKR
jgi:hypothetical protein